MNDRTKWILIGSGVSFAIITLAIGFALFIVKPSLQRHYAADRIEPAPQAVDRQGNPVDVGGLSVGQPAPDFSVTDVNGNIVRLGDFQGQPILLKFWTPECPPCVGEVPDLQKAYESLEGQIVFLTVVVSVTESTARSFVSEKHITYPVLLDKDDQLKAKYKIKAFPFTYLIDPSGIIRKVLVGARPSALFKEEITGFLVDFAGSAIKQQCATSGCSP